MNHTRFYGSFLFMAILAAGSNAEPMLGQAHITTSVVGAGATEASGSGVTAHGTVGQPIIGFTGNTTVRNDQGFWFAAVGSAAPSGVREQWTASSGTGLRLHCSPNPATSTLRLHVSLPRNETVSLRLYDALGRNVLVLIEGQREKGESLVETELDGLPPGYYTAELVAGETRVTEQIIVVE